MRVTAVGGATELGRIGKSLQGIAIESSPLRDEIGRADAASGADRHRPVPCAGGPLLDVARRLARWAARRHHLGDGHSAAGISGHHDRLSRTGSAPDRHPAGTDAAPQCHRNTGRNHCAVRGQDRDADREPHGRGCVVGWRPRSGIEQPRRKANCPSPITSCSSTPSWPARSTRTIRWSRPSIASPTIIWATRNTCIRTGRWRASMRLSSELARHVSHLAQRFGQARCRRLPRAHPKRSPIFVTWQRMSGAAWPCRQNSWRIAACACWASPRQGRHR